MACFPSLLLSLSPNKSNQTPSQGPPASWRRSAEGGTVFPNPSSGRRPVHPVCPAPATVGLVACAWLSLTSVPQRRVGDRNLPRRSGKGTDSVPADAGCSPTGLAGASDTDPRRENVCGCHSDPPPRGPQGTKLHFDSCCPRVLPQPDRGCRAEGQGLPPAGVAPSAGQGEPRQLGTSSASRGGGTFTLNRCKKSGRPRERRVYSLFTQELPVYFRVP